VATDTAGMITQGRELAKITPNVVVKLPTTVDGLKALRVLRDEGCRTNLTLCFSPAQALLVARAGATCVSPFLGRLDDIAHVDMDLVRTMWQRWARAHRLSEARPQQLWAVQRARDGEERPAAGRPLSLRLRQGLAIRGRSGGLPLAALERVGSGVRLRAAGTRSLPSRGAPGVGRDVAEHHFIFWERQVP